MFKKKLSLILLVFAMVMIMLPATVFATPADLDDNTSVVIPYNPKFNSGSGTEADPFYAESFWNRSTLDGLLIETENPHAKINGGTNALNVTLNYGMNDIKFSVTSADGTKTVFYHLLWERMKAQRPAQLTAAGLYVSPESAAGNDGKIMGLNPEEYYDYKLASEAEWKHVNGVSEITGLPTGAYQIRYGESDVNIADTSFVSITVSSALEKMEINNLTNCEIDVQDSVSYGERVDFKIKLGENEWIHKVKCEDVLQADWVVRSALKTYFTGYTSDSTGKYYNGYFIMTGTYNKNRRIEFKDVTFLDANYYSVKEAATKNAITTITPENKEDVISLDRELRYKENSKVTVDVKADQTMGTSVLKSFKVYGKNQTVVASSENGQPVDVTVNEDLEVGDVIIEYIWADYTAMEEQLERVKGVDLYLYTDSSRVVVEDRLNLSQQMYKRTQKDQYLVDEFVPTLKAAIDALEPKAGIFTKIEKAKEMIPEDLTIYMENSVTALNDALAKAQIPMDEKWDRLRQDEIDMLGKNLETAVKNLQYKAADYTKVDAAIEKANALNKNDYMDFSAVEKAINAVVRDKNITEQQEVDSMAQSIEDAIAQLEKKPETKDTSTGNINNSTTGKPKTGDNSPVAAVSIILLISIVCIGTILIVSKKGKRKKLY